MRIIRFYTTNEGGSRFEEIEVPVDRPLRDEFGNTMHQSKAFSSPSVRFVELADDLDQGWHNAPARQLVFVLSGTVEVGTTDGEKRRWSAGAAFMPDDLSGKGHTTVAVDGPAMLVFVELPAGFDPDKWSA